MRPSNAQQPSAPPSVQSNSQYSGQPFQMPQPFGSGIGFKPQVIQNTPVANTQNFQTPYPPNQGYPQAIPSIPPYPQTAPPPANQFYAQPSQNYQNMPNQPSQNYPAMSHQSPHGQAFPIHPHNPPTVYPNLNHSAPFSYTQPTPNNPRSTSDFMRKVIAGKNRDEKLLFSVLKI